MEDLASSAGGSRRRRRAMIISLAVGFLMLAGKWTAYVLTGSQAILSDAMESVIHVFATGAALYSLVLSQRPPDPRYPYGYGKVSYFSAGFEGGLITIAAVAILYGAIRGLIWPQPLASLGAGIVLIGLASLVNLLLGGWLVRMGRRDNSLILEADGHHILSDSYTSFGVLAGVILVALTGWRWLDPVVAILVGLSIIRTGYMLVREAALGLMDRADPELLEGIVGVLQANRQPDWLDLHQLRAWKAGDRVYVDCHMVVPGDWTVSQLHEANDHCRRILKQSLGPTTEVLIHFDPDKVERSWSIPQGPWTQSSAVRIPGPSAAEVAASELSVDGPVVN